MAAPFGFSVGDFLAVGKLLGQVATEFRENGEAAGKYQSILIELEALDRALRRLQCLKPTKYELLQFASIRATALACQRPLQDFLNKISKFEIRLGTFSAGNNRWKGFPCRMQFRVMFRDDVEQLRSILASHVATLNLLLQIHTLAFVSAAEEDRVSSVSSLENKILAQRQMLEIIDGNIGTSLRRQQKIKASLQAQHSVLVALDHKVGSTVDQLQDQQLLIQDTQSFIKQVEERTIALSTTMTGVASLATLGVTHLRQIVRQIHNMLQACAAISADIRIIKSELVGMFSNLLSILRQIDNKLPTRLCLPIVQFTTALGDTIALPYELCQKWGVFTRLVQVVFEDRPGKARVDAGLYSIMNARGGRLLKEGSWKHAVKAHDHLSMSIWLNEVAVKADTCPFSNARISPIFEASGGILQFF